MSAVQPVRPLCYKQWYTNREVSQNEKNERGKAGSETILKQKEYETCSEDQGEDACTMLCYNDRARTIPWVSHNRIDISG